MEGSHLFLVLAVFYRIVAMGVGMVFVLMGYQILSRAKTAEVSPGSKDVFERYRTHFGGGLAGFGILVILITVVQGIRSDGERYQTLRGGNVAEAAPEATEHAAQPAQPRQQFAANSSSVPVEIPVYDPQPQYVPPEPELEPLNNVSQPRYPQSAAFPMPALSLAQAPLAADSPSLMIQRARSRQGFQPASAVWNNFFYRTAFDDVLEEEYFDLYEVEPLWEKEDEPAVLELKLLIDDLERAGSAREPVKHRQFVLDLYKNEIVYLRKALRMAEMYDLAESEPEIFSLGNLELALNVDGGSGNALDGD